MQGIRSTRFRRLAAAAAAAVAVVAVVAGCGGGGSSTSSSSGGSSGSFAGTAEAACTNANKQIAALGTPQQSEVHQYLETTESVIEKLHKEVQAVAGSGAAEQEYVNALGKSVVVINEMSNAALSENFDAVRELSDKLIAFHLGELAEAAELKACAEVPESES
jgi:hypothetical protein